MSALKYDHLLLSGIYLYRHHPLKTVQRFSNQKFWSSAFFSYLKSTKKFSFEPKLKDQKIKLVRESSFLYFWEKK